MKMKAEKIGRGPDAGRTILMEGGAFVLVELALREATSAPARMKAIFGVPVEDKDGNAALAAMPVSGSRSGEFRIELN